MESEHKPSDAREHLQQAILLAGKGKLAEAQAHCAKALLLSPNHFGGLHLSAVIACQLGESQRGIELINKAIGINPRVAEVHNDRGMALRGLRRWDEALASFDKAIALNPEYAAAHNNRGLTLHNLGRLDDALACFARTIELSKDYADAHNNRGRVLQDLVRFNEAIDSFDKAIQVNPALADAHYHRGNALSQIKQFDEALLSYDKAIALNPDSPNTYYNRGYCLLELQDDDRALESFRQAIALKPDLADARFQIARLTSEDPPATAPNSYVSELFDSYAEQFEYHLVKKLKYSVPEALVSSLLKYAPEGAIDILDLGCGTGLLGSLLVGHKRQLIGIDLSERMIQKAREKNVYDSLYVGDMVDFLSVSSRQFEAVLAADVFIYVGDLGKVFKGVRGAIVKSGLFAFSLERSSERNFILSKNGRYSHSRIYLEQLAAASKFLVRSVEERVIRYERDEEVIGYVVVLEAA